MYLGTPPPNTIIGVCSITHWRPLSAVVVSSVGLFPENLPPLARTERVAHSYNPSYLRV
jgi:hypothetical protein